jgi:hypothetical protein
VLTTKDAKALEGKVPSFVSFVVDGFRLPPYVIVPAEAVALMPDDLPAAPGECVRCYLFLFGEAQ